MSKRAQLREKRRRERIRNRAVMTIVIVGGAFFLVLLFAWPSIKPIGEIILPEFRERPMADGRAMGDPDAPVTVEVFEDFQCPACINFSTSVEPLIEEAYIATGDVYYIFRHYPFLDDNAPGEESNQAASASMCAADQDRFWDYHDILFVNWNGENRGAFSNRRLVAFAQELGLDMTAFEACFESRTHYDLITHDFQLGGELLVTGTPAIFVDGEQVTPGFVPSFAQVSQVIDAHLAALEAE
jgi:protein-disulfide isomerase